MNTPKIDDAGDLFHMHTIFLLEKLFIMSFLRFSWMNNLLSYCCRFRKSFSKYSFTKNKKKNNTDTKFSELFTMNRNLYGIMQFSGKFFWLCSSSCTKILSFSLPFSVNISIEFSDERNVLQNHFVPYNRVLFTPMKYTIWMQFFFLCTDSFFLFLTHFTFSRRSLPFWHSLDSSNEGYKNEHKISNLKTKPKKKRKTVWCVNAQVIQKIAFII